MLLKIPLVSAYQDTSATITYQNSPDMIAEVEGNRVLLKGVDTSFTFHVQQICDSWRNNNNEKLIASTTLAAYFQTWLSMLAPDCNFRQIRKDGWYCDLPSIAPADALSSLQSIHTTMVTKWNRQPYLFTRRLAFATTLAQALESSESKVELEKLCKVLHYSLPQEMPAVFNSKIWHKHVCNKDSTLQEHAAKFGLQKAYAELEFLQTLLERTSTLGTLTVRIPRRYLSSNVLWVSLKPSQEVTDRLAEESLKIWAVRDEENVANVAGESKPNACWHPLFSDSASLIQLAQYLGLAGNAKNAVCLSFANNTQDKPTTVPSKYIADSIASETEFVISNGHSKVLRLPQGLYSYTIQTTHNQNIDPEEEIDPASDEASSGVISWTRKGGRAIISNW
jgi:hypothetical protein